MCQVIAMAITAKETGKAQILVETPGSGPTIHPGLDDLYDISFAAALEAAKARIKVDNAIEVKIIRSEEFSEMPFN